MAGQRTVVIEEPPHHLGALTPSALLTTSRHDGLVDALICGLVGALLIGPAGATDAWLRYGQGFAGYGLVDGVAIGFTAGAVYGMSTARNTWLYYNWLRLHLARHDLLPRRLPEFPALGHPPQPRLAAQHRHLRVPAPRTARPPGLAPGASVAPSHPAAAAWMGPLTMLAQQAY